MKTIANLADAIIAGGEITFDEAVALITTSQKDELYDQAERITKHFFDDTFDSCSIVNGRSGKCSENCKWCAQSAHFKTNIETYPLIPLERCLAEARHNNECGIKRFSIVTSGKAMRGKELDEACNIFRHIGKETNLHLCASMGLLNKDELQKLWDAGVHRYHCNLEAGPSYFKELCTTHTVDDKIQTILAAKEIGFEVCSGGIIGMGESAEQRVELAFKLKEISPVSIPINILSPIKGTPLQDVELISDDEILATIAVFRFVHPKSYLRFAGGRARLSKETQRICLRIGINGSIMGDMLTTTGSQIKQDQELFRSAGYKL